jgi:hypothetical protein
MLNDDNSLDLTGIGKLAKSIPQSVYERTTETITSTFEKLVAPITETTSGFGRYIRQKFDNMVEVEKSLFIYSFQNAQKKIIAKGLNINKVSNPKAFVKIMENASQETDELLNVLWTNLLYSQLTDQDSHPFFINVLSSLSKNEAIMLESLNSFDSIGEIKTNVIFYPPRIKSWVKKNGGEIFKWNFSCNLLCEFGLAKTVAPFTHKPGNDTVILYRTEIGNSFLKAVEK